VPLGQISANHVHKNNSCYDVSKEASIVTTRALNSKALQLSAGILKCKVHSVSWKSFFFLIFFSEGRPEGSKRNLNFQSATWHHLKHFQRKAEGDQPVISVGATSWLG